MATNNINISILNFDTSKSKRNKSRSINDPLENIYSGKILKIMRIGGVRVKIQKDFTLGEFTNYSVSHQVSENEWKVDFHSKNINKCVDYVRSLNQAVSVVVDSIINDYNKIEKDHKQYEKIKTRKNNRAYPNE